MKKTNEISDVLKQQISGDEQMLWNGRPKKGAYILNETINLLPFAILWLVADTIAIVSIASTGAFAGSRAWFLIPFFAFHLMPVWIWIAKVIKAVNVHKNLEYCITDKNIYIKRDENCYNLDSVSLAMVQDMQFRQDGVDKALKVGDIYITDKSYQEHKLLDCKDYLLIKDLLKKLVDINRSEMLRTKDLFCQYCGSKIQSGITVCSHCGASLQKEKHDLNWSCDKHLKNQTNKMFTWKISWKNKILIQQFFKKLKLFLTI